MSPIDPQLISKKHSLILPSRIIEPDINFKEKFNLASFSFNHNLAGHPLFEIPRLVELSDTILKKGGRISCQISDVDVHRKWSEIPQKQQIAECLAHIEESGSWLLLFSVQSDPQYKVLLDQIVAELEDLSSVPLSKQITWLDAYIFVASPYSITPYHIDHESTFLFQIHGQRVANIFNSYDRSILSEQEIEQYYMGNLEAANYREENQCKASVYKFTSGKGIHHPPRAPHWFKNESNYSVALGVHFCMRSDDWQSKVYQVNYYLRKLGLKPTPPTKSPLKDKLKVFVMGLFSKRNPQNKFEFLRSGVIRINSLLASVGRTMKFLK